MYRDKVCMLTLPVYVPTASIAICGEPVASSITIAAALDAEYGSGPRPVFGLSRCKSPTIASLISQDVLRLVRRSSAQDDACANTFQERDRY